MFDISAMHLKITLTYLSTCVIYWIAKVILNMFKVQVCLVEIVNYSTLNYHTLVIRFT